MVYYPFHFVEKSNPEHTREKLQGLRSCTHTVFALLEGFIEKNCFKMEWALPLFPYGTKARENNGPNGQPAQCMTPSEFYKIRYIQRYSKATNWILCLCFCCGSTICHWWRFCLFAVNILNFSRPRLFKLARPLIRSKKESFNFPGVLIRMT